MKTGDNNNRDARPDIIGLLIAVFVFASLQSLFYGIVAVITVFFFGIFMRVDFSDLLRNLKLPFILLIPLFIFLPLTSGGEILFSRGGLEIYREGLVLAGLIFFKTWAILFMVGVIFSRYPFRKILHALKGLHVPGKFLDLMQITYRYIFIYREDLAKMRTSLTLRGYHNRSSLRNIKVSGSLIGSLLVRSFEQTESLYHAMIMRGYGPDFPCHEDERLTVPGILRGFLLAAIPVLIKIFEIHVRVL